jgi:two-component system chemotaxis response regulator CheY
MKSKIMIVDDSAIVRQQVSWALMQAGFEVLEAVDGQDAADQVAAGVELALMLCDVNMPRMNGIDLLTKLAGGGNAPPFPVVMLTTDGLPELVARAKTLGAKGWMVKPVKPEILVATVKKLASV